jgi:anti-sigma factor RsiW
MDYNAQLKLQAFLDRELPEREATEVANGLAQDCEAAALLEELLNTRGALAGAEEGIRMPESREFFWSKVQREIERLDATPAKPAPAPLFGLWRRFLVPASGLALVVVAGLMVTRPFGPATRGPSTDIETALADSGAFTYRDYSAGTTLVWLSYPADNEIAQDDEIGTVD